MEKFDNLIGVRTLYIREVRRFFKVKAQTILAPMVTTLLFLTIFSLAFGGSTRMIADVPFVQFLAPGLIMMAIVQNAFANTSSSIVVAKVQGNIVDTLMPPLTPNELTFGIAMGGVTRGLVVGFFVCIGVSFFVEIDVQHLGFLVFHAAMASLMLSLLGVIGGIWAEKFDQMSAITNFFITPLSFLSGTFYSIQRLPEAAQMAAHFNPFFYMIDGFRYSMIGHADGSLEAGVLVMILGNAVLWVICGWMFASGYKLKA
uniref:Transport permease protein n=1 Tax=uncultured nuHF1 cluster bacterium HF0770_35I22 TaxID=723586 RepID=E7C7M9_9BACT|nr:ABC-type multidrug transport system, permease component [uncultured nuHF1 cluster bacterium HF0770_35I22]